MNYKEKFLDKFNEGRNPNAYNNDGSPAFPGDRGAGLGARPATSRERIDDIASDGTRRVNAIIDKAQKKIAARRKNLK